MDIMLVHNMAERGRLQATFQWHVGMFCHGKISAVEVTGLFFFVLSRAVGVGDVVGDVRGTGGRGRWKFVCACLLTKRARGAWSLQRLFFVLLRVVLCVMEGGPLRRRAPR